jgi:NTE family protein
MSAPNNSLEQRQTKLPVPTTSIALALGGGGARGLAHILMLEAFDELGLRPKIIAGTSIGALYGAAYASGMSAKLIRAHTEETLGQRFDLMRQVFSARAEPMLKMLHILPVRGALLSADALLDFILPSKVASSFNSLQIPLKIVATDFYAQEAAIFTNGPLRPAMAASMALPAIFAPVMIDGRVLVDGGLVNPLPFDLLKGEADITVAIDVSGAARGPGKRPKPSAIEVLMASSQILQRSIVREKLQATQPDIYIDVAVDAFTVLDFLRFRDVLKAAIPAKEQLKRQLGRVLSAQTLPSIPPSAPATRDSPAKPARKRLASLKRLTRPRAV